jgi:hypothetical protein
MMLHVFIGLEGESMNTFFPCVSFSNPYDTSFRFAAHKPSTYASLSTVARIYFSSLFSNLAVMGVSDGKKKIYWRT